MNKLLLVCLLVLVVVKLAVSYQAVWLRDIKTLKLRKDRLTTGK